MARLELADDSRGPPARTPGPPTRTSGSTCPTTAAWRSYATRTRCAPPWRSRPSTCRPRPRTATRRTTRPSCRGGRAASRSAFTASAGVGFLNRSFTWNGDNALTQANQPFAGAVAVDAMGRSVTSAKAGVYFVREEPQASSYKQQAVRKVVVQR